MARFSLGQLLAFVFACCVYLAAMRSLYVNVGALYGLIRSTKIIDADTANKIAVLWLPVATQIGAWLILFVLYCHWRLWVAMVFHCAFAIYLALDVIIGGEILIIGGEILAVRMERLVLLGLITCTLGTLASFPIAVITVALRGLGARSQTD